jgi:acetyl esterase/lipase
MQNTGAGTRHGGQAAIVPADRHGGLPASLREALQAGVPAPVVNDSPPKGDGIMRVLKDLAYGPHGERNLLDLYLPERVKGLRPLVALLHGGGWHQGGIVDGFMGKALRGHEAEYREASPIYQIRPAPPPFLIIHGTLDVGAQRGQVPIEISVALAKRLRAAGGETTLIKLAGAGHGFTGSPHNEFMRKTWPMCVQFFGKHLG